MREHDEDWLKQLNTVIIRIAGLHEIFSHDQRFLDLLSALEGLLMREDVIDFYTYRKTVFECISLLQELKKSYD